MNDNSRATTRSQLAAGQRDAAQRSMHTLKGTAGTIGASPLAALAEAAEQALAQGQPDSVAVTVMMTKGMPSVAWAMMMPSDEFARQPFCDKSQPKTYPMALSGATQALA